MEKIIIQTNPAGKRLYQACQDGFAVYAAQLDQVQQWSGTLKFLEERDNAIFEKLGYQNMKGLMTTSSLLTIAASDLSIIVSALYLTKQRLEQIYYMKSAYLIVYETYMAFQGKQQLLKKEVNEADEELQAKHKLIIKSWRKFIADFKLDSDVKNVRHKTGGHINTDFSEWYAIVLSLDPQHTANMLIAFTQIIQDLQFLLNPLIQRRLNSILTAGNQAKERSMNMVEKMEQMVPQLDFSALKDIINKL
ncbi:hypothetical protein ACFS5N_05870 [Mucilaginibacter ximonensis]|uniref:Uncharacterized protein n=1 Tax=Mucilaginibacter ximonensis TaxID=538021 RepID=A0ABW5Y9R2_9SPHI